MRVEQEQKVTEDARIFAEQDAAAQKYASHILQVSSVGQLSTILLCDNLADTTSQDYQMIQLEKLILGSPNLSIGRTSNESGLSTHFYFHLKSHSHIKQQLPVDVEEDSVVFIVSLSSKCFLLDIVHKYALKCTSTYMLYLGCLTKNIGYDNIECLVIFILFEIWKRKKIETVIS